MLGGLAVGAAIGAAQWLALRGAGMTHRAGSAAPPPRRPPAPRSSAVAHRPGTDVGDLVMTGLITGAAVGAAQGSAARPRRPRRGGVDGRHERRPWGLGWLVTSQVIVDAERGFHMFGASGALTATVLTGLALRAIVGARAPRRPRPLGPPPRPHRARRRARSPLARGGVTLSATTLAGLLLIAVPVAFNVAFGVLAARFDYPDVLRRPTAEVLAAFSAGGTRLVLTWWAFALTAVAMVPLVVVLSSAIGDADATLLELATATGVLAALVQFLGLIRWPFLVPYLAREAADPDASEARREAVDVVFQAFNRYLGVAVGEHLGYALTGAWTLLAGAALTQSEAVPGWTGFPALAIGPLLMLCALEFVGGHEPRGWRLAERLTPPVYVAWSLWLAVTGVALLAA